MPQNKHISKNKLFFGQPILSWLTQATKHNYYSHNFLLMKNLLAILLLNLLFASALIGQAVVEIGQPVLERRPGEMVVQLTKGVRPEVFIAKLNRLSGGSAGLYLKKNIVAEWDLFLIGFEEGFGDPMDLVEHSNQMAEVVFAQLNDIAQERSVIPNDPDWLQQSDMSLIKAPEAWATSTGGLTLKGDTIVVAVLEKGILFSHPDLVPNRWWNWAEIPNDGIDNDGNGFVDDRGGWNPSDSADNTGNQGFHGTAVCGIIGAVGNNDLGVAGINWNIKMMNLSGVESVANILEAYFYVYNMRRRYNETNGAQGAFVVATNASFGFDNSFPSSMPGFKNWCSFYDSLGKVGVLNVGATTNANTDVDTYGDMPTFCGSEYLITVNQVNALGSRISSGYGKISIDLAAPGTGTYTTYNVGNNTPGYKGFTGTSAATPHVTGAVGLLYSLGCEGFTFDALTDPGTCALRVRDAILNNTEPTAALKDITVTGGYLNLERAINGVTEVCNGAVGILDVITVQTQMQGNEIKLFYQTPTTLPYKFRVFNMLGQQLYEENVYPKQFYENFVKYDFTHLPRAVYILSISRGNAIVSVKFPKI